VVPSPFFVSSDMAYPVQAADIRIDGITYVSDLYESRRTT
jgi:hypothetical protein